MTFYKRVKFVIFDMDGLLLNTEDIYFQVFKTVLGRYGVNYTQEMRVKIMGTIPRETYKIFIKEYNLPVKLSDLFDEMKVELTKNMGNTSLMPGALKLVSHLKKHDVPIAVATSSDMDAFVIKTEKHDNLFLQFHHTVVGGNDPEVIHGKPAPDIFLACASRFDEKLDPDDGLVFEDAPNGVQAAIAAKMQVVMVPDKVIPEEKRALATKVIDSLLDFKPEEFGLPPFDDE